MSFAIQSKHILELYRYSNYFLSLVEEKGPVPLKVCLIVVEAGWCPCTVQSLYSLKCLWGCMCVRVHDGVCVYMHVHIKKNIFIDSHCAPNTKEVWIQKTRSNSEYRLNVWKVYTVLLIQTQFGT